MGSKVKADVTSCPFAEHTLAVCFLVWLPNIYTRLLFICNEYWNLQYAVEHTGGHMTTDLVFWGSGVNEINITVKRVLRVITKYKYKVRNTFFLFSLGIILIGKYAIGHIQIFEKIYIWPVVFFSQRKIKRTRIEPVGEPYREVCLRPELWPETVLQPNCWSKRQGTWIEHVLAYCRDGKKYVGCIELLF